MRFAVLLFPGTWSDHDCHYVLRELLGQEADLVWHRQADLSAYDCVVLPGVLLRNESLQFRCQDVHLRAENLETPFTRLCRPGQALRVPISHGEGRYYADEATLDELEANGRVAFRYCTPEGEVTPEANPNGSLRNIAGIVSGRGNVLGLMPHPERASEALMGGDDALLLWRSVIEAGVEAVAG